MSRYISTCPVCGKKFENYDSSPGPCCCIGCQVRDCSLPLCEHKYDAELCVICEQSRNFNKTLAAAQEALTHIGTGELRAPELIREGARTYSAGYISSPEWFMSTRDYRIHRESKPDAEITWGQKLLAKLKRAFIK